MPQSSFGQRARRDEAPFARLGDPPDGGCKTRGLGDAGGGIGQRTPRREPVGRDRALGVLRDRRGHAVELEQSQCACIHESEGAFVSR